jgi:hypothetical protein
VISHQQIDDGYLECIDNKFLIVKTGSTQGAWCLLASSVIDVIQVLVILAVFYEVPRRCYGQYAMRAKGSFLQVGPKVTLTMNVS